jgi:tetratricopeptide (TPR) repeat protein
VIVMPIVESVLSIYIAKSKTIELALFNKLQKNDEVNMDNMEILTKELKSMKRWVAFAACSILPIVFFVIFAFAMAINEIRKEKIQPKRSYPDKAKMLFKTNKLKELTALSDDYIKKYPTYYAPYYYRMLVAVQSKEYEKAIQFLEKVYELNPKAYEQFGSYMKFLKEHKKQLNKSTALNSDSAVAKPE